MSNRTERGSAGSVMTPGRPLRKFDPALPRSVLLILLCSVTVCAQTVTKVDPPSWWANHTINPVRLLVRGTNLRGARVSSSNPALRASNVLVNERGTYLFTDVHI